jgi:hypothetical protein
MLAEAPTGTYGTGDAIAHEENRAMHLSNRPRSLTWPRFVIALVLIAGLLLPAIPVHAIHGSDPIPGGKYPYVGGIWIRFNCCVMHDEAGAPVETYFAMPNPPGYPFFDEDGDGDVDPEFLEGPKVRANGVLLAPNVVLTQGAHFGNGRRVGVSFKEQIGDIDPEDDAEFDDGADGVYAGSVYHMPGIDRESEGFIPNDLAVIVLDENVAEHDYGGVLATLPALGALDAQEGTELTAISYGPQIDAPLLEEDAPTKDELLAANAAWDFTRRQSPWTVTAVDEVRLRLEAPGPSWYCDADQGAPFIDDRTGTVAALMTFWPEYCHETIAYGYRLDTQEVRDFLCAVSQGQFSEVKDTNVDGLLAETDPAELDPVRYELTRESAAVLDEFC